ncbi:Nek1, partial [Symbiodinium sp. CCMP2456]
MADNYARSSESGSDPEGVDITRTGGHDSPFQGTASDDDVSVQSDFAAGMDISYQAPLPRDIEAFLAPQGRERPDHSSDSNDAEIPATKSSLQGADINLTSAGVPRDPRAARPKARPESRPAKTPKNAARARGSVGRQVREGQSTPPPPTSSTPPAPVSFQDRAQMGGALDEHSRTRPEVPSSSRMSVKSSASYQDPIDPQVSSAIQGRAQTTPPKSPRFAWDARLSGSSQQLETEHGIEGDAIGGAMSVKLVSWTEPLKITPFPVDVVERNARILQDLHQSSRVHLPPQMEWMFLANLIQQYTGPAEEIFDQVTFYESKQQVYWKHHLKKFFTTKPTDPAVHRYTLFFAHGTNSGGAERIINSRYLAPATIADGPTAVGHYSQATNWTDNESQLQDASLLQVFTCNLEDQSRYIFAKNEAAVSQEEANTNINDIGVGPGLPSSGTNRNVPLFRIHGTVISNRFTRELNIDGIDIMDVKLSQVTTGGNVNWGLRSLANGRHTVFESFKSRQEAIMAGTLMRALRGESTGTSGADLNATLTHMTKTKFPGCSTERTFSCQSVDDGSDPSITERECQIEERRNEADTDRYDPDELATLPPRSREGSPDLAGCSDEAPAEEELDYADPLETVDAFRPQSGNPVLDDCKLDNWKVATINSWISTKVGKDRMNQVRTAADELSAAMSRLTPGSRPALDAIAVSWGLPVTVAAKVGEKSLSMLIAACYVIGRLTTQCPVPRWSTFFGLSFAVRSPFGFFSTKFLCKFRDLLQVQPPNLTLGRQQRQFIDESLLAVERHSRQVGLGIQVHSRFSAYTQYAMGRRNFFGRVELTCRPPPVNRPLNVATSLLFIFLRLNWSIAKDNNSTIASDVALSGIGSVAETLSITMIFFCALLVKNRSFGHVVMGRCQFYGIFV